MATPSALYPGSPVPPNWFTRHWKWAVPLGMVALLLLLSAFVGAILLAVESTIQHSGFYPQALERAQANPQVANKIGQPLKAGWFASGNINISGSSGDADIAIPISGPNGKGTIYVVAKKSAGLWTFRTLQVEVPGESQRIDLLQPEKDIPGITEMVPEAYFAANSLATDGHRLK